MARAELDKARRLEAERHEADLAVRDTARLRLFTLRQELAPYVGAMPEADDFIHLSLVMDSRPRLWIDLTSFVEIAPDGRSWRLVQDTAEEREIIFETAKLDDMTAFLRKFIALRIVRRHKALNGEKSAAAGAVKDDRGDDIALLVMVWLAGMLSGVFALLAMLMWSGRL